jgi:hypothetical protein
VSQSDSQSDSTDHSLPLCEVLAQEYQAVTGKTMVQDDRMGEAAWMFQADDILEPKRLADRLKVGVDRSSGGLRDQPLEDSLGPHTTQSSAVLKDLLANWLNTKLMQPDLYEKDKVVFECVRFRSQTRDYIEEVKQGGQNWRIRNRLILEDTFPEVEKVYDRRLKRLYAGIREEKLAALCLSGGGIRSATFGLGVVQGLARKGLLDKFHYLSTVSGGGYLGSWLSAWIYHTSLPEVLHQLRRSSGRPLEPDPTPIWHLRTYSNYLSPKLGLLSTDTWTLLATYVRNLFLNWLVLLPPLVGLLSIPYLLVAAVAWTPAGYGPALQGGLIVLFAILAFGGAAAAVRYVHANRPFSPNNKDDEIIDPKLRPKEFLKKCLVPLVVAAVAASLCWAWLERHLDDRWTGWLLVGAFALIGALVHLSGWLLAVWDLTRRPKHEVVSIGKRILEGLIVAVTGAIAGVVGWCVIQRLPSPLEYELAAGMYVWLAVPVLLTLILVFHHIYIGYYSNKQVDAAREWSARFSGWILAVVGAWLVGTGLVILAPAAVGWLFRYVRDNYESVLPAVKTAFGVIGLISGAVTLKLGHSADTSGKAGAAGQALNLPLALAAPTFIVFLVVLLGWIGSLAMLGVQNWVTDTFGVGGPGSGAAFGLSFAVIALLIGFGMFTAHFVNMNRFSLHAMYRARLIRAYLGASRPAGERDPNPFSGFDEKDNVRMCDLRPLGAAGSPSQPLLHVVNVALNLVGGSNLAWQQRKAEPFTFSPLHCGAKNHGYRYTQRPGIDTRPCYAGSRGPTLGTAITISGAAASPNMGYHSSPVIGLLLSLFNVRLGWWLGNPGYAGRKVYQQSAPGSSLQRLADEAFGLTDDKNPYVYLSDGGHFENLGLYEMVLRRCQTIVVSDGGCDPTCAFEDLGNAVRKIRIDLGIPIELSEVKINPRVGGGVALPGKYCAIGRILYSCMDKDAEDGTLIYLKPAFYGTEPKDVYNYAKTSPDFPHESTGDQFFSESQFESYRALGSHIIEQVLPDPTPDQPVQRTIVRLAEEAADYAGHPIV